MTESFLYAYNDDDQAESLVDSIRSSDFRPTTSEERERFLGLLTVAAASPDREARCLAAFRLGGLLKDARPVAEELIKALLLDDDYHVRFKAALSAVRASDRCKDELAPLLVPIFLEAANREQGRLRKLALQCLVGHLRCPCL